MRVKAGRLAAVIMLMLFLQAGVPAESGPVYMAPLAEGAVFIGAQGDEKVPASLYGTVRPIYGLPDGEELYAAGAADGSGLLALVNAQGAQLTEFEYRALRYDGGAIIFSKNQRTGVMDTEGNILIEAEYTALTGCGDGGYLAVKTDPYDDSPDSVYRVEPDGSARQTGIRIAGRLNAASEGLIPALSAENGLYGYLNAQGEWAIEPAFEWADDFRDGMARTVMKTGEGLIDPEGKWLLAAEYEHIAYDGADSLIAARNDEGVVLFDPRTLERIAEYGGEAVYAVPLEGMRAAVMSENGAVIADGEGTEYLKGMNVMSVGQWPGMGDRVIARMAGTDGRNAYLFGTGGESLAGPYREIMPLGLCGGEMYYAFTDYEAAADGAGEGGQVFWDEVPGTRKCGVIAPDGEMLCAFDAVHIVHLGDDVMLVRAEGRELIAGFSGSILKEYILNETGEETE